MTCVTYIYFIVQSKEKDAMLITSNGKQRMLKLMFARKVKKALSERRMQVEV